MALLKPTNGSNADYANRIGLLFDAFNNGNYQFPATAVPSADPNTFDDYEEGTWTPTLTFATPGNLNVAYATRLGWYTKLGQVVKAWWHILTSTFTHTSASGNCQLNGIPFAAQATTGRDSVGSMFFQGITKAGYTQMVPEIVQNTSTVLIVASGSAQNAAIIAAADMPTAGAVYHVGQLNYTV